MRKVFLILILALPVLAASEPAQKSPRFRHIQDADNKILATLDTKENKIEYKEDPKKVVEELIKIVDATVAECNKQLTAVQKKPEKKK